MVCILFPKHYVALAWHVFVILHMIKKLAGGFMFVTFSSLKISQKN
jgi:hypothetical protein